MRQKKNLFDFAEFSQCVSKWGIAVEMAVEDFFDFRNNLSSGKDTFYPYLKDVSVAQFRKGYTKIDWKESHLDTDFKQGEFIMKKYRQVGDELGVCRKPGPRGVLSAKLKDIITKIGPLIPKEQSIFWESLPRDDKSSNLTLNYDHLERVDKSEQSNNPISVATRPRKDI